MMETPFELRELECVGKFLIASCSLLDISFDFFVVALEICRVILPSIRYIFR